MATPLLPIHNGSVDSLEIHDLQDVDIKLDFLPRVTQGMSSILRYPFSSATRGKYSLLVTAPRSYRRLLTRSCYSLFLIFSLIILLLALTSTLYPSYTTPPPHYSALQHQILTSDQPARGNPQNEKIFIAASLYDPSGTLTRGHWATSVLDLITLLGEDNVFLSIYENDSGEGDDEGVNEGVNEGQQALTDLSTRVPCNKSLVHETLAPASLPKITLPDGTERVKRITYLAETRNRALRPLDTTTTMFDKILYLNDIAFNPIDAVHLLFSTNAEETGTASYRAACAVDFINPVKFYDTFATRDLEGYSMGLPFYPWFSSAGSGSSRSDVLAEKDAVAVKSCWGGMVAFDARFFQKGRKTPETAAGTENPPARFRAVNDTDIFWDASECCLIHADIQAPRDGRDERQETGIYMNPYVRVAYDPVTLYWLGVTRRVERAFTLVHYLGNWLVGLPWVNHRRGEVVGEKYQDVVYVPGVGDTGSFEEVERIGSYDGFCGRPGLSVIVPRSEGGKGWKNIPRPVQ
ncbi:cryptococcal mannosyltransferase 1-domain-containing protein [Aspergillus karnatakaensis]|uniref:glycosyltransferase family 69 protein n=1 Tax=Aspergillus karnatakaensis TaxID=1810916 RepID=UPI003CCD21CE